MSLIREMNATTNDMTREGRERGREGREGRERGREGGRERRRDKGERQRNEEKEIIYITTR